MKKMKTEPIGRWFFGLILILASRVDGYGQFCWEAELRPRAEYRYGYKQLASADKAPIFLISQRIRFGTTYKHKIIEAKIILQDVRVWGDETQYSASGVFGNEASIDLAEAWFSIQLNAQMELKTGRQQWSYDDERLLARRNWNQNGIFYDALTLGFESGNWNAHLGLSYNNAAETNFMEPYNPQAMKSVGFLHVSRQFSKKIQGSCIVIYSGKTKNDSTCALYVKSSSGLNVQYTDQRWKFTGSFYYQFGNNVFQGVVKTANAYNLNLHGIYQGHYGSVNAGCSVLSGDHSGDVDNQKTHLFDLLYGARHKYYGFLDYFSNLRKSTKNGGLNDMYAGVGVPVCSSLEALGTCHVFYLNRMSPKLDQVEEGGHSSYLGTEMDIWFNSTVSQLFNIQGGYSFILPGNTLKQIQKAQDDTPFSSWVWVMVTVSLHSN